MRDIGVETFSMLLEIIENAMQERGGFTSYPELFIYPFFICLPRGYPCVALYQRVVLFGKVIGLVLGSEIVIPEKVRMGRIPLALE